MFPIVRRLLNAALPGHHGAVVWAPTWNDMVICIAVHKMRSLLAIVASWFVCLSVCQLLSCSRSLAVQKNCRTDRDAVCGGDPWGLRNHALARIPPRERAFFLGGGTLGHRYSQRYSLGGISDVASSYKFAVGTCYRIHACETRAPVLLRQRTKVCWKLYQITQ